MTGGQALILAGAGMLSDVVEALVLRGWYVVVPSRRYCPIPALETEAEIATLRTLWSGQPSQAVAPPGRAIWVEAGCDCAEELAKKSESVLQGPVGLLVAWVHGQYRCSVLEAVEPLLAPDAPVVEIRAADEAGAPAGPEPSLAAHPTQVVLLGLASDAGTDRALSQHEIVDGALAAVDRALGGHPPSVHQVGRLRPSLR